MNALFPSRPRRGCTQGVILSRPTLRGARAFTLVEILIAMGILSLILAAIYSTWTSILRASKVGLESAAAVQRARITGRIIQESLTSVQSFAVHQQTHPDYYYFYVHNGGEACLSFVSRLSPSFPRSGKFSGLDVRRVTFSLERSSDGDQELVLRQNPLLMDLDTDEKNYPLVLAKHVKEFKIECWDTRAADARAQAKNEPGWLDEWKDPRNDQVLSNQIPGMIKVTLKVADNKSTSQVREEVVRIVAPPSLSVPPTFQVPGGGRPGGPPGGFPPGAGQGGQFVQPPGNPAGGIRKQ